MINKILLIGNAGKDSELKHTQNNVPYAMFSVATSESYKDKKDEWQQQTEWHNVIMWNKLAEYMGDKIKKGNQVYLEGKITHRKYNDKDGVEKYVTEIVASKVRILGGKKEEHPEPKEPVSEGNDSYDENLPF